MGSEATRKAEARAPRRRARPRVAWAVRVYDRAYRLLRGLDRPSAKVGPALRIEIRRSRRRRDLSGGEVIRRGDFIGILHLDNERIAHLNLEALPPNVVAVRFRHAFVASLVDLAEIVGRPGRWSQVRAFGATTIMHVGLVRLGFEVERRGPLFPAFEGACQRLLLASLHPTAPPQFRGETYRIARGVWITRENLLELFGPASSREDASVGVSPVAAGTAPADP